MDLCKYNGCVNGMIIFTSGNLKWYEPCVRCDPDEFEVFNIKDLKSQRQRYDRSIKLYGEVEDEQTS